MGSLLKNLQVKTNSSMVKKKIVDYKICKISLTDNLVKIFRGSYKNSKKKIMIIGLMSLHFLNCKNNKFKNR